MAIDALRERGSEFSREASQYPEGDGRWHAALRQAAALFDAATYLAMRGNRPRP